MHASFGRAIRTAALPLLLAATTLSPAFADSGSSSGGGTSENPLTSDKPPPNAPVQSGPGTTATGGAGVNTAPTAQAPVIDQPTTATHPTTGTDTGNANDNK